MGKRPPHRTTVDLQEAGSGRSAADGTGGTGGTAGARGNANNRYAPRAGGVSSGSIHERRKTMATKHGVYRDFRNGRFISKRTAERRPATTEREHVVLRPSGSNPKK